jgi:hypothetical protein
MDIVYPLKRSAGPDDELRYSLRSLQNLPHDRVFLVGGRPEWVMNVEHIDTERLPTKYKDATANIEAACRSREVSDPFILMNDDFFIMEPIDEVPVLNRGRVRDVIRHFEGQGIDSCYLDGMRVTLRELEARGYEDPLSFEVHVPMVVHKQERLAAIEMGRAFPVWHARTAYAALMGLTGTTITDVKVSDPTEAIPVGPFVSSTERSFKFGCVGYIVSDMFPHPSPYEAKAHVCGGH